MALPNKFTSEIIVEPSYCDFQRRLGYYDTFRLFMDLANKHATILGVGQNTLMDRNLFWLTVKTRVQFHRRPFMGSTVKAETWPVKPGSLRTDRCYRLSDDQGILAEGRTEWAVMDMNRGRLANVGGIFPEELVFSEDSTAFTDFPRIVACDESYETKGTYRVSSSDIDMGLHMNNTAYIRALMGCFSIEELKDMDICDFTIIFKTSAHEGDILTAKARREGNVLSTGLYFEDGKPAVLVNLTLATAG